MFNKQRLLLTIAQLILSDNPRKNVSAADWMKILVKADYEGWLYYDFDGDKLSMVAVAYRIKEINEKNNRVIPRKEEGSILWIPFVVSATGDKLRIRRNIMKLLTIYKDVEQLAYFSGNGEIRTIKRGTLAPKGDE